MARCALAHPSCGGGGGGRGATGTAAGAGARRGGGRRRVALPGPSPGGGRPQPCPSGRRRPSGGTVAARERRFGRDQGRKRSPAGAIRGTSPRSTGAGRQGPPTGREPRAPGSVAGAAVSPGSRGTATRDAFPRRARGARWRSRGTRPSSPGGPPTEKTTRNPETYGGRSAGRGAVEWRCRRDSETHDPPGRAAAPRGPCPPRRRGDGPRVPPRD